MKSRLFSLILITLFICPSLNASTILNGDPIKIIRNKNMLMLFSANKIEFDLSSSKLNESAIYELSQIAISLIQNPNLKIEIAVHNDTRSDLDYSNLITKERANSIKEFFVNYGVKEENLIAIGYGDAIILNKCKPFIKCTDAEHGINKRIELIILNPEELNEYAFELPEKVTL